MSNIVDCPSCQRRLHLPEELLGQLVRCPTCGETFRATPELLEVAPIVEESPPRGAEAPREYDDWEDEQRDDLRRRRRVQRRLDLAPHRGTLILILGILSILLNCIGLILGPMAWVMGSADLREIRAGRMDSEGEGLTQAGRICGIIGTVWQALALCCGGAWFLAMIAGEAGKF